MSEPHEIHSRRLGDLITYVQNVVNEVNDYLSSGRNNPKEQEVLMRKQASSMSALQQAMDMQKDIADQLGSGITLPSRRATDPARGKPDLRTVEDREIINIKRLAGIES